MLFYEIYLVLSNLGTIMMEYEHVHATLDDSKLRATDLGVSCLSLRARHILITITMYNQGGTLDGL